MLCPWLSLLRFVVVAVAVVFAVAVAVVFAVALAVVFAVALAVVFAVALAVVSAVALAVVFAIAVARFCCHPERSEGSRYTHNREHRSNLSATESTHPKTHLSQKA